MSFAGKWTEVETMMLSETIQTQKDERCMFSVTRRIYILKYVSHERGWGWSKEGRQSTWSAYLKYYSETIASYANKNI